MTVPQTNHEQPEFTTTKLAADIAASLSPPTGSSVLDLRLTQDFASVAYGKPVLTDVAVSKPSKAYFFRVRPGDNYLTTLYTLDASKLGSDGIYAVGADVVNLIMDQVRLVNIRLAITAQGVPYLIPVPLAGADGKTNPWHKSLARALELAETRWIRLSANMCRGGYDVFEAVGQLPEPQWPEESFEELLELAFRGRLITSQDHPLVQQLLGAI